MKKIILLIFCLNVLVSPIFWECTATEITWYASGSNGVVAAGPRSSVQAGLEMLSLGGNAVDAAVAAIFNLAVSDFGSFCIGGEVPFMFYSAKTRKVKVFNGMGGAPKDPEAIEWFYTNGIPFEKKGIRLSTVPSAISTCLTALEMEGTLKFEQIIAPTLKLLDAGGRDWYSDLARTFRRLVETEKNTPGTREVKIRAARDRFYRGDIADELNEYYIKSDAWLRKTDLESHRTIIEEPVTARYRGYSVYKCNTWTQGPVFLQSLELLEHFNLKSSGYLSTDYVHIATEAMKLAFADRDKYYGDPAFVNVPMKQLLSKRYNNLRYKLIDKDKASSLIRPGDPYKMLADAGSGQYWPGTGGTTTCAVVDKWGNAVAATPSSNGQYGICPGLGIAHNTRLSTFNTQRGHPNCLEPGKRPRITLTPTIILKNNKPFIVMSVAGGDMQDQVALQLFLDVAEFGKTPKEAVSTPRFNTYHTEYSFQPSPDPLKRFQKINTLEVDSTMSQGVIENLQKKGHIIEYATKGPIAYPAMIYVDQKTGICYAATEPHYYKVNNRGKVCGALEKND